MGGTAGEENKLPSLKGRELLFWRSKVKLIIEKELNLTGEKIKAYVFHTSLLADEETPIGLFSRLGKNADFILESAEKNKRIGRYSFIGGIGAGNISIEKGEIEIELSGKKVSKKTVDPLKDIEKLLLLKKDESVRVHDARETTGFFAGLCGYLAYDCIEYFEPKTASAKKPHFLPEAYFFLPQFIIKFDHYLSKVDVFVTEYHASSISEARMKSEEILKEIKHSLTKESPRQLKNYADLKPEGFSRPTSSFKKEDFLKAVIKAKEYIFEGDIFQVVLSQRFSYPMMTDEITFYRLLRLVNPSPYMFFYRFPQASLIGASPEPMLRVFNGEAVQRPIAGTRKRGATTEEDEGLENELLSDEKELAEHTMLVDLARNDLGRVSSSGSVKLEECMTVERYSHVMHIVSQVKGKLKEGETALSALRASFPAGTVSGAPKIRAMQIIDELEPVRRGPYSGAFGYVNLKGDLDTCLLIRSATCARDKAYVQAGAGIVADSDPFKEHEETINKAKGLMTVLEKGVDEYAMRHR